MNKIRKIFFLMMLAQMSWATKDTVLEFTSRMTLETIDGTNYLLNSLNKPALVVDDPRKKRLKFYGTFERYTKTLPTIGQNGDIVINTLDFPTKVNTITIVNKSRNKEKKIIDSTSRIFIVSPSGRYVSNTGYCGDIGEGDIMWKPIVYDLKRNTKVTLEIGTTGFYHFNFMPDNKILIRKDPDLLMLFSPKGKLLATKKLEFNSPHFGQTKMPQLSGFRKDKKLFFTPFENTVNGFTTLVLIQYPSLDYTLLELPFPMIHCRLIEDNHLIAVGRNSKKRYVHDLYSVDFSTKAAKMIVDSVGYVELLTKRKTNGSCVYLYRGAEMNLSVAEIYNDSVAVRKIDTIQISPRIKLIASKEKK